MRPALRPKIHEGIERASKPEYRLFDIAMKRGLDISGFGTDWTGNILKEVLRDQI
jgi:hypothetical protein